MSTFIKVFSIRVLVMEWNEIMSYGSSVNSKDVYCIKDFTFNIHLSFHLSS